MKLTFEQIREIILHNPGKNYVDNAQKMATKLMMHVHGVNPQTPRREHFESEEIWNERKKWLVSNKDVMGRLLQQEDMVFSARGGSSYFNLPDESEKQMNSLLDDVRYSMPLRKWVRNFALQAYRCDPMGVILMEVEQLKVDSAGQMNAPKAYPTYKSSYCIFDYLMNGRSLEYVVFRLTVSECITYGIKDEAFKSLKPSEKSDYYRVIDDAKDLIVQRRQDTVALTENITQKNPLPNTWGKTPGFIVSDLIQFNDPSCFVSPLDPVVELADAFLYDRSIRDLQKMYHGFAKAVEPLMQCATCGGDGYVSGDKCPSCTPKGAEKGTGYNLKTKISDVARFPLDILKEGSFDFTRIFGYVSPDIKGWEKQDASLEDLEEMMEMTYWGTVRMKRPKASGNQEPDTATEVKSNDAPKEARLNMTADWAEKTEGMIADYIGKYWFETGWKKASISYGRDYILKSADELMQDYQDMRTKGAPDFSLDEALEKYYRAKYQNNPVQMTKYLKMLDVEPFPHLKVVEAKGVITDFNDYNAKLYFGEWANTVADVYWLQKPAHVLIGELKAYVTSKGIKEPEPEKVAA